MDIRGPIMIIEDDLDDQFLFQEVFESLNYGNEILFFGDGFDALKYLTESSVKPFIIFSDTPAFCCSRELERKCLVSSKVSGCKSKI